MTAKQEINQIRQALAIDTEMGLRFLETAFRNAATDQKTRKLMKAFDQAPETFETLEKYEAEMNTETKYCYTCEKILISVHPDNTDCQTCIDEYNL